MEEKTPYRTEFKKLERGVKVEMQNDKTPTGKYIAHYLFNDELSETQQALLEKYEYAASLLRTGYAREDAIKFLVAGSEKIGLAPTSRQNARDIVAKTEEIFGEIWQQKKDFRRWASIQFYDTIAVEAKKEKDYKNAIRAREIADRLSGIFEISAEAPINPEDFANPEKVMLVPGHDLALLFKKENEEEEEEDNGESEKRVV